MKERVTITVASDILKHVDSQIDGSKIKNRSHAIELLLNKSLGFDMPNVALIMAAGKMRSIRSSQGQLPIPMHTINKRPILEHVIDLFRKHGVKEIYIALCYHKEIIQDYFGDGSRFGVRIRYIEEDKPTGTTNLIRHIIPIVQGPFFVTNADELKDLNLFDMYRFHTQSKGAGTIALTTVRDPSSYGVVNMDGMRIKSFTEKPRVNEESSKIINAGLYLFNPDILDLIPKRSHMIFDFLPHLAKEDKLYGYIFSGQWFDINSDTDQKDAQRHWIDIK